MYIQHLFTSLVTSFHNQYDESLLVSCSYYVIKLKQLIRVNNLYYNFSIIAVPHLEWSHLTGLNKLAEYKPVPTYNGHLCPSYLYIFLSGRALQTLGRLYALLDAAVNIPLTKYDVRNH